MGIVNSDPALVTTNGQRKWFHASTNVKMPTAAVVARDSGIQICQYTRHIVAPSTSALSSSSRGTASNARL